MRNFENVKKVVIKIGTNVLTKAGTVEVDAAYIRRITKQIAELRKTGRQVVVITSGAIGMGAGQLTLAAKIKDIKMRQACAAIGQPLLMAEYRKAFARFGVTVAQVLLTAEVLNNRRTYLNLRNSIEKAPWSPAKSTPTSYLCSPISTPFTTRTRANSPMPDLCRPSSR
jgi:glutamate 5-kinase